MDYQSIRKQISYLTALVAAYDAVEAGKAVAPKEAEPAVDIAAAKTSARNIALAGSGDKAALMGTLAAEPAVTAKDLTDIGMDEKQADEIIIARDTIRSDALKLTAVVPK